MNTIFIMVTGATGYIGSNIISSLLTSKHNIRVIAALKDDQKRQAFHKLYDFHPHLSFRYGHLPNNPWDMNGINILIHCAGALINSRSSHLIQVNITGTKKILLQAKKDKVKHIIYLSSQSIYGIKRSIPLKEDIPAQPASLYAVSKLAGELLCQESEFNNIQIIVLRIARVYGYGLNMPKELLPHIYADKVAKGEEIPVFTQTQNSVNYVHIRDLTQAVEKSILNQHLPQYITLNLGSLSALTNIELATICQNSAKLLNLPLPALKYILKGSHLSIDTVMNIQKIDKYLGWKPHITMAKGMQELIKSKLT